MNLQSNRELQTTREKLRLLEEHYRKRLAEPGPKTNANELSMQSLKRMINQLTEEIARYEAHAREHAR
ncbi:MAG: hypothetical protein IT426_09555 [Pirellulales bacterium]|nr:hypothetical protein [Pirellulales bacterium]